MTVSVSGFVEGAGRVLTFLLRNSLTNEAATSSTKRLSMLPPLPTRPLPAPHTHSLAVGPSMAALPWQPRPPNERAGTPPLPWEPARPGVGGGGRKEGECAAQLEGSHVGARLLDE